MPRTSLANRKIKEARKESLLEAAFLIISEKGLGGLTFNELGKTAGASHGLAYHYFGNREELISALAKAKEKMHTIAWARAQRSGSLEGLGMVTSFFENRDLSDREINFALFELRRDLRKDKDNRQFGPEPLSAMSQLLEQAAREELIPYGDYAEKSRAVFDYLIGYLLRLRESKKAAFNKAACMKLLSY